MVSPAQLNGMMTSPQLLSLTLKAIASTHLDPEIALEHISLITDQHCMSSETVFNWKFGS